MAAFSLHDRHALPDNRAGSVFGLPTTYSPVNGATDVAVDVAVTMSFSEEIYDNPGDQAPM